MIVDTEASLNDRSSRFRGKLWQSWLIGARERVKISRYFELTGIIDGLIQWELITRRSKFLNFKTLIDIWRNIMIIGPIDVMIFSIFNFSRCEK